MQSKAMHALGIKGVIYVPAMVEDFKCKMIQQYGSTVEQYGHTCAEAESKARAVSEVRKGSLAHQIIYYIE